MGMSDSGSSSKETDNGRTIERMILVRESELGPVPLMVIQLCRDCDIVIENHCANTVIRNNQLPYGLIGYTRSERSYVAHYAYNLYELICGA